MHVVESRNEAAALVKAEMAENVDRKDWLPSEKVAIAKAIRSIEESSEGATRNTHRPSTWCRFGTKFGRQVSRQDCGGELVSVAPRSPRRRRSSTRRATSDCRRRCGLQAQDAVAQMDRTGKISPAAKKVAQAKAPRRRKPRPAAVPPPTSLSPGKRARLLRDDYAYRREAVIGACRMLVASANTGELISAPSHIDPPATTDELVAALNAVVDVDEVATTLALIDDAKAALTRYANALAAQVEHQREQGGVMAFSLYDPVAPGLVFPEASIINNYSTRDTSPSARANARAVKRMTRVERMSGGRYRVEDIDADWAVQRERVRARWLA